jgi:peptidoglycan/LPS O-acetylase OafA/YrhL
MNLPVSAEQTHLAHPKYRPDIDGLRAIAVLLVVAFHAFPIWIRGGFIGVDIFFVISGYLISSIIFENLHRESFSFMEFYNRRIRRIFPALLIVLTASFSVGWFVLLDDEYKQLGKHIAGGAGFIENFLVWGESGYFDNEAATKPLLHLWTLGIEEQFYIIWPLVLWSACKLRLNLLTIAIVVALISFALNIGKIHADPIAAFYAPQTRFWELMEGSILAYIRLDKQSVFDSWMSKIFANGSSEANPATLNNAQSLLGTILIVVGVLIINKESSFPGWWAVLPTFGTVLIISAGPHAWLNRAILSRRIFVWFGLISFPLYLWHWPLLSFAQIIAGGAPSREIRIVVVLVSIALAWLTYMLLEKPIRFGKHGKTKSITLLVLMVVVGNVGYSCYERDGYEIRKAHMYPAIEFDPAAHWVGWEECTYVAKHENNGAYDGGCKTLRLEVPADVALIGDSHAGHLASGLKDIFKNRPENLVVMTHAGCYPFYTQNINAKEYFECWGNQINNALDFSIKQQTIQTVILSGYAALQIQHNRYHWSIEPNLYEEQMNSEAFKAGMENTLARLVAAKKRVVYVIDIPELYKDPKSCLRSQMVNIGINDDCGITRKEYAERNRFYRSIIDEEKVKFPSVVFIDSSEVLCDDKICSGFKNGSLLYATRDHLTPTGSKLLLNHFASIILRIQH